VNFVSYAQLVKDVHAWSQELPKVDLILGVPRSGLLVANILALHRNIPVQTVRSYFEGLIPSGGRRLELGAIRRVLVVEDSVYTGHSIEAAKEMLKDTVVYGAVYVAPGKEGLVDFYHKTVEMPRIFEWNLYHSKTFSESCVDLDGVLCRDPTSRENDDGLRYENFINIVTPKVIPTVVIDRIVTARLERYRGATAKWLNKHNIRYRKLHMLDLPTGAERRRLKAHVPFKMRIYKESDAPLFVESSYYQARAIAECADRPVLCTDTMEML
jgi:orotate phosphoribosyltransferase